VASRAVDNLRVRDLRVSLVAVQRANRIHGQKNACAQANRMHVAGRAVDNLHSGVWLLGFGGWGLGCSI